MAFLTQRNGIFKRGEFSEVKPATRLNLKHPRGSAGVARRTLTGEPEVIEPPVPASAPEPPSARYIIVELMQALRAMITLCPRFDFLLHLLTAEFLEIRRPQTQGIAPAHHADV